MKALVLSRFSVLINECQLEEYERVKNIIAYSILFAFLKITTFTLAISKKSLNLT